MKTKYTVFITDKTHEYYNQRLEGFCAYYDLYHTGNGPDLYLAKTPEGTEFRLLSDQIDTEDYNSQELSVELKRLGANINDIVMIKRLGSGSYCANFDLDQPHKITHVSSSGHVTFDSGKAHCFQPDVIKYNGNLPVQLDFTKYATNNGLPF